MNPLAILLIVLIACMTFIFGLEFIIGVAAGCVLYMSFQQKKGAD